MLSASPHDFLYVSDGSHNTVERFDAATGEDLDTFVAGGKSLKGPRGLIFDDDGHLLVANQNAGRGKRGEILRYDAATGAFAGEVVPFQDPNAPFAPRGIVLNNNILYVASLQEADTTKAGIAPDGRIAMYDGDTGAFLGNLTRPAGLPGQFNPRGIVFGPDGMLYVSVFDSANLAAGHIVQYDPGADTSTIFATNDGDGIAEPGEALDLHRPEGLTFGPDGRLYVASFRADATDTDKVVILHGVDGTQVGAVPLDVVGQPRAFGQALVFGPDDFLFVPIQGSGPDTGAVRKYDVGTGNFTNFLAPGTLGEAWYLTFGNTDPATLAYNAPESATAAQLSQAYGQLPLSFEANQGQTDSQVDFLSRGSGFTLFLTPGEAVFSLAAGEANDVVRMHIVGADSDARSAGLQAQAGRTNYLIGDDPSQWHTGVANYGRVEYQDVYAGIDLVYYGNQRRLEYDFVVAPGADPNAIRLAFDGVRSMELDTGGNLILHTAGGDLVKDAPVIYQELDGERQSIAGRYVLEGDEVRFEVGQYDQDLSLVIDPILSYSTYLGGSDSDKGFALAVDKVTGEAYVTGETASSSFPTKNPMQARRSGSLDVFVTKFNAAGSALVYSTYLGGKGGERGFGIAVDGLGNAYVTGVTNSTDFPTKNPFQAQNGGGSDSFLAKLNASGSALVYSTYLGGAGGENFNTTFRTGGIAVDGVGNAYVTGKTDSLNFPTTADALQPGFGGGQFDAFMVKIDTTQAGAASRVYATYLGGSGVDEGKGIAVDSSGNVYVTGPTGSDLQTVNAYQSTRKGGYDAFVTKLNSTGSAVLYSTFLGGSGYEGAGGIAVDHAGHAFVTGRTSKLSVGVPADFPTTLNPFQAQYGGGQSDAFVAKFDTTQVGAASLVYSTYFGGSGDENFYQMEGDIAVDAAGYAYVTGVTGSTNFPTMNPFQATYAGGQFDGFVTMLNPTGSGLVYSSYLGGSGSDDHPFGIAVDDGGNAYVAGSTNSTDFPTVNAFQRRRAGGGFPWDAFVTKIAATAAISAASSAPSTDEGVAANPLTVELLQPLLAEARYRWQDAGVDVSSLHGIDIRITDLPGARLGMASGNTIWLDDNAAGWGWLVDQTPSDDLEFVLPGNQGEQNRMDLLTVVMHELGHLLGHDHDEEGVMAETLAAGVRRTGFEHDEVVRADQVLGQAGDEHDFAWLGAWLNEQFDSAHGRGKRRR